ncbi:HNH endonuclease family protein [Streptomyces sp. TR06-5]|uniref:HNH endonuclease family protein n=1 Tax=unclassified Streptomyces TaxID=2593676 RepID=UPI0039A34C02
MRARTATSRGAAALGALLLAWGCAACGPVEIQPGASGSGTPEASGGSPEPGASGGARDALDALTVRAPGTMDGYARDRFPHWSDQGDRCDTRDVVLRRDGEDVRTDDDCEPVSGTWRSPYDDGVWTDDSDVDIDHMVPLAEAWRSGARSWDDERREAFANDLSRPQLFAVTDEVNQAKGDSPPDEWKPERRSSWCTYAQQWITVKAHYDLSVTRDEKDALEGMLDSCAR